LLRGAGSSPQNALPPAPGCRADLLGKQQVCAYDRRGLDEHIDAAIRAHLWPAAAPCPRDIQPGVRARRVALRPRQGRPGGQVFRNCAFGGRLSWYDSVSDCQRPYTTNGGHLRSRCRDLSGFWADPCAFAAPILALCATCSAGVRPCRRQRGLAGLPPGTSWVDPHMSHRGVCRHRLPSTSVGSFASHLLLSVCCSLPTNAALATNACCVHRSGSGQGGGGGGVRAVLTAVSDAKSREKCCPDCVGGCARSM
jgi:hypothetical protein